MVIPDPTHRQETLHRHTLKVQLRNTTHSRLIESRNKVLELLAVDAAINNRGAVLNTVDLQNEI